MRQEELDKLVAYLVLLESIMSLIYFYALG